MKKEEGIRIAKLFREKLRQRGYPVQKVLLFGSVAMGKAHSDSDIDIAVICKPFLPTRHDENMEFRRTRREVDVRIETVCIHTHDLDNKYSTIVQEIKKHGIPIF